MRKESEAILLRIFIGESDKYEGKLLYKYLLELFKQEGLAGATVLRGIAGFGKSSRLHTTSILRLSTDLPIVIEVADRKENIRRIAEVSKLFMNCGIIIINSFISPTEEIRKMALDIIGQENFFEVFVSAPLEVCEKRDTKGLYAKARRGEIKNFTGIDSPFELPQNADATVRTDIQTIEESVNQLLERILPLITTDKKESLIK